MLKLTAIAAVLNVFFVGFGYAHANVTEASAPLQPPVAGRADAGATPAPALTLRRGLRTTTGAAITNTRHS